MAENTNNGEKKKSKVKNENDEEEEEAKAGSSSNQTGSKGKKGNRSLRFQLPEFLPSEDSFTSALSYNSPSEETEEISHESKSVSILKKYILAPLRQSLPRIASPNPCLGRDTSATTAYESQESKVFLSSASSSKQLFEILRHSPTPSDADLNLINATYLRKLERVKEAIDNGADVNTFRDRQTPLIIATEIGDDRLVKYLLTVPNINPDFQNLFGQTPLIVAVRNAFDQIVRLLLNHNADVNIADHMGKTPLHGALFQQRSDMARLLLAYGADYEQEDCFGERPMYTSAVKKPNLECLTVLLKSGASPEYSNVSGTTLLSRAIMNWTDFRIIEALVQYGASVNTPDVNTGKTPLHFAAMNNDLKITKFLVNQGADPNVRTVYNFTPFQEAIFHKSLEVAEFLLDLTANASTKTLYVLRPQKEK